MFAVCLLLQHWTFDGEVPGATLEGRIEYRDSAVGGKALVFNGVDTRATFEKAPEQWGLWFFAADAGPTTLAGDLQLHPDGSIRLGTIKTAAGVWFPGQWVHVTVLRDEIRVNNERVAEGDLPPPASPFVLGGAGKTAFRGLVDDLRFNSGFVSAMNLLPWHAPRRRVQEPFARFELFPEDVVALVGGESLASCAAPLEARLGGRGIRFRSLAWEGDTVFEQRRDVNFGPLRRSLSRAGASVVVLQFGQMESLRGDVDAFRDAYDRLLASVQERTKRIVLLSPTRFEARPAPLPEAAPRNAALASYVDVCRELAKKREALFVDLAGEEIPTRDGVHPTSKGAERVAAAVAKALEVEERAVPTDALRSIEEKNRLWFDYWRPMNWAFLEGDRDNQPFSRDPRDLKVRGLAIEMQDFLPLIRKLEDR